MITLRQDKNEMDISIHDMMMLDTKTNMLEAYDLAGLEDIEEGSERGVGKFLGSYFA